MKEMAMARGAKTLVETCAGIEHGENVIVCVDYSMMGIGASHCFNGVCSWCQNRLNSCKPSGV